MKCFTVYLNTNLKMRLPLIIMLVMILVFKFCEALNNFHGQCDLLKQVKGSDEFIKSVIDETLTIAPPEWLYKYYDYVNCTRRGLTEIPNDVSNDVEFLDLSFNVIRIIRKSQLSSYNNVVVLRLAGNCAKNGIGYLPFNLPKCIGSLYIEPGSFSNLHKLKWLDLQSTFLHSFPQNLPKSIAILDLFSSQLGNIINEADGNFTNLEYFIGGFNCLTLPSNSCISQNFTIGPQMAKSLKVLDLRANSLTNIPGCLFTQTLNVFVANFNQIQRLKYNDFKKAKNLKRLMLFGASIYPLVVEPAAFDPLQRLEYLTLRDNAINFLPRDLFRNNLNLIYLDLSLNCLLQTVLQPTILIGLSRLKYLDISANAFCIPSKTSSVNFLRLGSAFSKLVSLEILFIGVSPDVGKDIIDIASALSVHIHTIDEESFTNLTNLTSLSTISITSCWVQRLIPSAWKNLSSLKSIFAINNNINYKLKPISTLTENVQKTYFMKPYSSLRDVATGVGMDVIQTKKSLFAWNDTNIHDYSRNQLDSIPLELFLKTVEIIDLSNNKISYLNSSFLKSLTNLQQLNLANNPLHAIESQAFKNLKNLQFLTFVNTVHNAVFDLRFLLNLSPASKVHLRWKGPGKALNDILSAWNSQRPKRNLFSSIISADLSGNSFYAGVYIQQDKYMLQPFRFTKVLSLKSCNLIDPLPMQFFFNFTYLEKLDLSSNYLHEIPNSALQGLKMLQILYLNNNLLHSLDKELFKFLPQIRLFSVAYNKITYIRPGYFSNAQLKHLDLSNNLITRLDGSVLNTALLNSLTYLDIRWNQLDCSCDVWQTFYLWYISDASKSTEIPGFLPTCTSIIDDYFGGCVACKSPRGMYHLSVAKYGYNISCELNANFAYALSFTAFVLLFLTSGCIGYSRWFKRFVFKKVNEEFRVNSLMKQIGNKRKNKEIYLHHGFVFYDHENETIGDWVDSVLIPEMRNGNPSIDLTLNGRDNSCCVSPSQEALRHIVESRKTIMFLTDLFSNTPDFRFILSALQEVQYSKGKDHLILVSFYDDQPVHVPEFIQETFNRKCYCFLRFDYTNDDEKLFLETLRTALCDDVILINE